MAKKQVITLTGDARLNAKLARLRGPEQKKIIRKASRTALKPVQASARAAAPKASGRLRRSIKVRSLARSRVRVGARVTTNASDNVFKGATYYGGFQEYGWTPGKRGGKRGEKKPGQKFMSKKKKKNQRRAMVIYRRLISTAIRKLATSG